MSRLIRTESLCPPSQPQALAYDEINFSAVEGAVENRRGTNDLAILSHDQSGHETGSHDTPESAHQRFPFPSHPGPLLRAANRGAPSLAGQPTGAVTPMSDTNNADER